MILPSSTHTIDRRRRRGRLVLLALVAASTAFAVPGGEAGALTPPPSHRQPIDRITLTLTPERDTTAPYATVARGVLVARAAPAAEGCRGRVNLVGETGGRTVIAAGGSLRLAAGRCRYAVRLTLTAEERRQARRVRITAVFAGNEALLPAASAVAVLRLD